MVSLILWLVNQVSMIIVIVFVFTPGICFDKAFYRIGYGKGYYDRFFNTYNGIKIGLCYDDCLIDDTYHDCYDIPVDIIVTDNGIKRYEKRKSN